MATFHDLAEARTGDHDFIAKNYNQCDEEKAIHDQFNDIY
jgi:5'-deoxynucleotidase YfbR-like HD superfamily hydrolase